MSKFVAFTVGTKDVYAVQPPTTSMYKRPDRPPMHDTFEKAVYYRNLIEGAFSVPLVIYRGEFELIKEEKDDVMHTPGPWSVSNNTKSHEIGIHDNSLVVLADKRYQQDCGLKGNAAVVCLVAPPSRTTEEDRANAKLIAEAPALLEACRELIQAMDDYECSVDDPPTPKHRKMMSKAMLAVENATYCRTEGNS